MGAKMVLSRLNGPTQMASVAINYSSAINRSQRFYCSDEAL
jgi:hypothetical protein